MEKEDEQLNLKDINKLFKYISKNRYKLINNNYKFDKWLFNFGMWIVFAWLFFVAYSNNFNLDYYECVTPGGSGIYFSGGGQPILEQAFGCENPFYKPVSWKNSKYLLPGSYGTKPGALFKSVFYFPFIIFGLVISLNHILHNRKWHTKKR